VNTAKYLKAKKKIKVDFFWKVRYNVEIVNAKKMQAA